MRHWGLSRALEQRREEELYRERMLVDSPQGPEVVVDGDALLAFCSNDYLGLANHSRVVAAFQQGLDRYGAGAGASHLVSGHQRPHHELELALAEFTGRERALLFSSGYQANLGIITALLGPKDRIFQDRLNHASLLDGGRLSGARFRRYAHNSPAALEKLLQRAGGERQLVASDAVFSMDGDIARLPELAQLCTEYNACLLVDDAHGFGVLGKTGAGSLQHYGLDKDEVPLLMGTLSKALGVMGAFVAGSETLIETLIQSARSYIYTTAIPPALAIAALESLRVLHDEPHIRENLKANIALFRGSAYSLGLNLAASQTAIQPLILGDAEKSQAWSAALRRQGLLVPAIRPPTVPSGSARLRIALSASHSSAQIQRLLVALATVRDELG
ncbi:MAG: 8-amino-7-oxononanoate synthase [Pseudomonadota bacterium]